MKNTLPWRTRTADLMPVCRSKPTSDCALPTELHGIPYIFIPHTSSWQPHQPTTYDAEPIRIIGLAIRIPYFNSFCMLRLFRNHSAFNSHNFPRTYTTTYLFSMLLSQQPSRTNPWCSQIRKLPRFASGCTYGIGYRLFPLLCIEVSFAAVSAQGFARPLAGLLATHLAIVYSVYSAYLPGLHAARPSAFVEGGGVEPPAHPNSIRGPPLNAGEGDAHLFHLPVCTNYSGFYLPYIDFVQVCCCATATVITSTASCRRKAPRKY